MIFNLWVSTKGYFESKRNRAFTDTKFLYLLGVFVWADAVVFGLFWIVISIVSLVLNDWIVFMLITSVFWVVRSMGETNYWISQQFSKVVRNPPEKMRFYSLFKNDSVWFVYQILWQCITVISVIFAIYFGKLWITSGI